MDARCPRCSTVFTTDRSGIQFCPNCGQQVDVPEPASRPAGPAAWGQPGPGGAGFGSGRFTGEPPPGGTPLPGHRELTPWERRKELGIVKGLVETWRLSVFSPQRFFPTVRPDVPWSEALLYAWTLQALVTVASLPFVAMRLSSPSLPSGMDVDPQVAEILQRMSGGMGVGSSLASLVLYPVGLLIGAAIYHLVAMLFGAAPNGFGATVRALCYSVGPNVVGLSVSIFFLLGLCATLLAAVWASVLLILAIASLQETSVGKATAIVVVPDLIPLCCCGVALAGGLVAMLQAFSGGTRSL